MRILFLSVGKTRTSWMREGIDVYADRLKHYCAFERNELSDIKQRAHLSVEQIKEQEGMMLLKNVTSGDEVVLLDERGSLPSSESWAKQLEKKMIHGVPSVVFMAGGAYGFSPAVYDRANELLALSRLTFSHQMVRLIFLEQLYRCFTIIKGEPYHHS